MTVATTGRFAEGTAVGYHQKKKGARRYAPLFGTIAQTGQVLDFLHRWGHVHDEMITALNGWQVAFTVSVPFER